LAQLALKAMRGLKALPVLKVRRVLQARKDPLVIRGLPARKVFKV
jgi:hypothetical protein